MLVAIMMLFFVQTHLVVVPVAYATSAAALVEEGVVAAREHQDVRNVQKGT